MSDGVGFVGLDDCMGQVSGVRVFVLSIAIQLPQIGAPILRVLVVQSQEREILGVREWCVAFLEAFKGVSLPGCC